MNDAKDPLIVTHGYKEDGRRWQFIIKTHGWKDFCRETGPANLSEDEAKAYVEDMIACSPHKNLIVGYQVERWGAQD